MRTEYERTQQNPESQKKMTQNIQSITERPEAIGAGAIDHGTYGVFGRTKQGKYHVIRLFSTLVLRSDEGIQPCPKKYAIQEAREIAKRNHIPCPGFFEDLRA